MPSSSPISSPIPFSLWPFSSLLAFFSSPAFSASLLAVSSLPTPSSRLSFAGAARLPLHPAPDPLRTPCVAARRRTPAARQARPQLPVAKQRCAGASRNSAVRRHCRRAHPVRSASSICTDIIFGKDSGIFADPSTYDLQRRRAPVEITSSRETCGIGVWLGIRLCLHSYAASGKAVLGEGIRSKTDDEMNAWLLDRCTAYRFVSHSVSVICGKPSRQISKKSATSRTLD